MYIYSQQIVIIYFILFLLSLKLWFCDIFFCIVFGVYCWHLSGLFTDCIREPKTVLSLHVNFFVVAFLLWGLSVSIFLMIGNWKHRKIAQRKNCLMPRKKILLYIYYHSRYPSHVSSCCFCCCCCCVLHSAIQFCYTGMKHYCEKKRGRNISIYQFICITSILYRMPCVLCLVPCAGYAKIYFIEMKMYNQQPTTRQAKNETV